ncbi:hypothetical protein NQ318_010604 [Aromia moschata]|uniref:Uncharacterized protein n=1 Tax=Aromia moschata TaxID=1265417 RepID=A0AAV8XMI3_9CUCU|nr:hypothetical protein NQ318_010604 [Aromia moschata]
MTEMVIGQISEVQRFRLPGGGGSDSSSNTSVDSNTPSTAQHSNNTSDNDVNKQDYKPLQSPSVPSTSTVWVRAAQVQEEASGSRRPSKDESTSSSNSESPQSGDEYNVYFYNSKDIGLINGNSAQSSGNLKLDDPDDKSSVFSSLRKCDDPWDVLFSRAEGLHAHGHSREACILGVKLAEELLMNPRFDDRDSSHTQEKR